MEHCSGGVGCLALAGSAGQCFVLGALGGEMLLQALNSTSSATSISLGSRAFDEFGILGLLDSMRDAGDFGHGFAACVREFLGVLALQLGHFGAAPTPAGKPSAKQGGNGHNEQDGGTGHARTPRLIGRPSHMARSTVRRFTRPGSCLPPAKVQRDSSAHAPRMSPALSFLAMVDPQKAPAPTL